MSFSAAAVHFFCVLKADDSLTKVRRLVGHNGHIIIAQVLLLLQGKQLRVGGEGGAAGLGR